MEKATLNLTKDEEFAKLIKRLRLEYEEIQALRAAANTLRVFRVNIIDARFD
jgi:hypothetical protein